MSEFGPGIGRGELPVDRPLQSVMKGAGDQAAEIFAEVAVEGDLSGQLAIGNNIVQLRIDTVHGDLVTLASGEIPVPRARPRPVSMLPRPPDPMFDRRDETARVLADAAQGRPVTVGGPPGIGTSTLLRHLATQETMAATCGGVAFLPVGGLSRDDILQVLFEVFYDCDVPLRPSPTRLRHLLQDVRAAIVLDDVGLTGGQLRELVDGAPTCGFVVGANVEPSTDVRAVRLAGLPPDDARRLFAHGLGRALEPDERGDVDALCAMAGNEPARILGAAVAARESAVPLAELAARSRRSERAPSPVPADADLRLLGLLAAVPGLTLAERHLVALSGLTDVAERLARWVASGVVVEVPGDPVTYRLGRRSAGVARWPIDRSRAALRAYFGAWARERRGAVLRPGVDVEALRLLQADADRRREWRVVLALGAVLDAAYAVSGRWDAWRNVAATMLLAARELGDRAAEAMALHQLGTRALCVADLPTALDLLGAALAIREGLGDGSGAAVTRHNLSLITAPPPAFAHEEPHDPRPWWKAPRTAAMSAAIVAALVGAGLLISRPAISGPAMSGPAVEFRPVAASFADQPMNRPGRPQQVDLVNTGRVTLHVTDVRVAGEHAADFSVAGTTCADELAAGQACTTTVVFTPVAEGARSAALVAEVTELDDGPQLPLSGAGSAPDPAAVTVDPAVLAFADQRVGTRGPSRSIQLNGPVTGEVALGAAVVKGQHAADFTITSNGCADVSLGSGRFCALDIHFGPSSAGPRTALLRISAGDGTPAATVPLRGAGTPRPGTGTPPTPTTVTPTPDGRQKIVPPVVGESRDVALDLLYAAGLVPGRVTSQASDTVAEGVVISSDPEPGSRVEPGSGVALIVSSGREPCVVPRVQGMYRAQAEQIIEKSCAVLGPAIPQLDADGPPDVVLDTSPAPGAPVEPRTAVSLTVSERGVQVPDVVGRTLADADAVIKARGLRRGQPTFVTGDDEDIGKVKSSSPVAEEVVVPGTTVDLVVFRSVVVN